MTTVEPLHTGDVLPADGEYMIFEFNPRDFTLTKVGESYSPSPHTRRKALEAAQAAAEQRAARGEHTNTLSPSSRRREVSGRSLDRAEPTKVRCRVAGDH